MTKHSWTRWPQVRDVVLFAVAIAGIAHETLLYHLDRPNLLILFGAMLGLPIFTKDRS